MKTNLVWAASAALLTVLAVVPAATAAPPQGPLSFSAAAALAQRQPIKPFRDEQGQALRSLKNSIITQNWSGYAVANFETALDYSSASGTWQVPNVVWGATSGSTSEEINSIWVGIGGFCENAACSAIDPSTLIQLGTMQGVSSSGAVANYVWYELYPAPAQQIFQQVNIGDVITASIDCTANCVPGQTQTWQLSMTDATLGWTWTQNFSTQSSMLSAEWIVEAPGLPTQPLNNFTQVNFDPVVANGSNPTLSLTTNGLVAENPYGQTSNPSIATNGDWFGACWGYESLTPCTAASFSTSTATTVSAALTGSPTSITSGASSTLTWDSVNAASCSGSGFSASTTSGTAIVYPTATKTYSVTCSGTGSSATASTTVQVSTTTTNGQNGHKKK